MGAGLPVFVLIYSGEYVHCDYCEAHAGPERRL